MTRLDPFWHRIIVAVTVAAGGTSLLLQLNPGLASLSATRYALPDALLNLGLVLFAGAFLVVCAATMFVSLVAGALMRHQASRPAPPSSPPGREAPADRPQGS